MMFQMPTPRFHHTNNDVPNANTSASITTDTKQRYTPPALLGLS